jgi:hypothetical protein
VSTRLSLTSLDSDCLELSTRSPDDAKIKNKMLFASSKDALRRALVGIAVEIQGTDSSEVAYESGMGIVLYSVVQDTDQPPSSQCWRRPRVALSLSSV